MVHKIELPQLSEDLMNTPLGTFDEQGYIIKSDYQLSNIHEFLNVFCQPNKDERP